MLKIPIKYYNLALKGGYENTKETDAERLLDPKFWYALGKSLSWDDICKRCGFPESKHEGRNHRFGETSSQYSEVYHSKVYGDKEEYYEKHKIYNVQYKYIKNWSKLPEHLAKGNSLENFFYELTKND